MAPREGSVRLWTAAGLSVLVHLLMGAAMARLPSTDPPDATSDAPAPNHLLLDPPPPEDPEVKVGIERSQHATITWIGFETPTEHEAAQAETEQPALTRDTPSSPVQPPETHTETQPPSEQTAAAPEPAQPAPPTASAENRGGLTEPSPFSQVGPPSPLVLLEPGDGVPLLLAVPPPDPDPSDPALQPQQEAEAEPRPASPPPAPQESDQAPPLQSESPPGEEPRQGEIDPRESDATSPRKPIVIRPGRPAAAEGLEIETRHLRLSLYGQVKAMPARLRVWATFDRTGRVRTVEWVTKTGVKELDEPILDCVYSWRAKGKALDDLPANNPKAGVRVPFEIVLR